MGFGCLRPGRTTLRWGALVGLAFLVLGSCADPLPIERFAGEGPEFDPVRFFTGHVRSWGVIEDRSGAPTARVTTDCEGEAEGQDGLHMTQRLTIDDGPAQVREWHMRRIGPHRFEASANDMVGTASGEARGRTFHWRWILATRPGDPLGNVVMEQWMYLMDDGAMVNRTTVRKLGFILAEVSEQFARSESLSPAR